MNSMKTDLLVRLSAKVLALLLCSSALAFSETNNFFQFVNEQAERRYTHVPHEVLAVYYVWYGYGNPPNGWDEVDTNKHVIAKTARYPVKGAYKSDDPAIIDWHIDQAKAHGITGFVVSWFGLAEKRIDGALAQLIERAEKKDFKIAVYWENQRDGGALMRQFAVDDLSHVVGRYGKSKAFLKIDGKPVIFVYGRVVHQTPVALWPDIVRDVRARAGDFALIADGYQNSYAYLFDGLHTYDPSGLSPDIANHLKENLGGLRAWAARHYEKGVTLARRRDRIACVMVTPGGDARKAYKVKEQADRLDGQTYRTLWDEAIKAQPDWILITSWNEWPEGSEIEPSLELGDKYLQITAEYSKRFLGSAPVNDDPAAPLPKFAPGTTIDLGKILLGRKVGVLMQDRMNDAEFWAAYSGATLQRFEWKDLIDSKVFNASNFPVLIHIGTEHFTSSVKITDDVTRSFVRFLREGGFLVCLPPAGTWPLLYDDSRKGVPRGITDTLALGIDNGFEQPPPGVELTFHVRTNVLFGLPSAAPFPKTGDLRWRPGRRTRVPAGDIYVPLMALRESTGKIHGDAVAYVEHRAGPVANGKTLYVWMRTGDAFSPEIFLPSVYQFISTRLKPLQAESRLRPK